MPLNNEKVPDTRTFGLIPLHQLPVVDASSGIRRSCRRYVSEGLTSIVAGLETSLMIFSGDERQSAKVASTDSRFHRHGQRKMSKSIGTTVAAVGM